MAQKAASPKSSGRNGGGNVSGGKNSKKGGQSGGVGGFTTLVLLIAIVPIVIGVFYKVSLHFGYSIAPSVDRPPLVILPFLGFSIFPLLFWISLRLFRALRRGVKLPFLLSVLVFLPLLYLGCHNALTVLYGNINNDAYSNSWMIDVIAPPSYFNEFLDIQSEFQLATNTSRWPLALKAPSWDVNKVAENHRCGPRVFVRYMMHNITAKARISKLFDINGLMFAGAWVLVEGKEGVEEMRQVRPKVFTDFAEGNDLAFNKILASNLLVDTHNLYTKFNNSFKDNLTTHIETRHADYHWPFVVDAVVDTNFAYPPGSEFLMDQYSCMTEAKLLHKLLNLRWCFYKMMKASETYKLIGKIAAPYLKQTLEFPTGSPDDCSKPYVNGVVTKDLHWRRDTYSC